MSYNDIPEFDYASHSMSFGKKLWLILVALFYALGFGVLWFGLFVGGMTSILLIPIGAGVTLLGIIFGISLPIKRSKRS